MLLTEEYDLQIVQEVDVSLKNCGAGRIEAVMKSGEKILISRHYAPLLRERLGM